MAYKIQYYSRIDRTWVDSTEDTIFFNFEQARFAAVEAEQRSMTGLIYRVTFAKPEKEATVGKIATVKICFHRLDCAGKPYYVSFNPPGIENIEQANEFAKNTLDTVNKMLYPDDMIRILTVELLEDDLQEAKCPV